MGGCAAGTQQAVDCCGFRNPQQLVGDRAARKLAFPVDRRRHRRHPAAETPAGPHLGSQHPQHQGGRLLIKLSVLPVAVIILAAAIGPTHSKGEEGAGKGGGRVRGRPRRVWC